MSAVARRRLLDWVVWVAVAVLAAGIAGLTYFVQRQGDQLDAMATALADEQSAAEGRGETPVAPDPEALLDDPSYEGPEAQPPPTGEQVLAAVEDYFRNNPVESVEPTAVAIAAAVSNYLTEHPPAPGEPGPPPTAEQIATAVQEYLTANPPASGPPGPQGERGPPPTAEEVAAGVEAYLVDHPLPMCPQGYEATVETILTTSGTVEAVICTTVD